VNDHAAEQRLFSSCPGGKTLVCVLHKDAGGPIVVGCITVAVVALGLQLRA
jgi:hypothetical protein